MILNPVALNLSPNPILQSNEAQITRLVVRGNPRNALACAVEFPLVEGKPSSNLYMARARAKRRYTQAEQLEHRHKKRATLYTALATAGRVLPSYVNKKGETRQHSTCLCRRFSQTHENAKGYIVLSVDSNHIAKITGDIVCDNNWVCPMCSSIHLDRKAKEITEVQQNFLAAGRDKRWSTWMLTLTIPHTRTDMLDTLMTKKAAVMSDFHAHSVVKKLKQRIGWQGYVDSSEVRHSNASGWHPHHHILNFCTNMHPNTRVQCVYDRKRDYYRIATQADKKRGIELHKIEVQEYIYHIFAYLCVKHGLKRPSIEHGVDFRKSDDIQDYLTKQSKIAHELTAEHDKKSSYSRSQWEILRDCDSDNERLASYSKALFCEFAAAMKGRPKIHWSPDFLDLWLNKDDDVEGDGLADDEDEDNDKKIYKISIELWNRFFTNADRVHRRQLLDIAELDSLNRTSNTEIHLYALSQILKNEKIAKRADYVAEQEQIYQKWLVKIPDSCYEDEAQKVYDYDDYIDA